MKKISIYLPLLILLIGCSNFQKQTNENKSTLESIFLEFGNQLKKDVVDDNINGSISASIVKGNQIIWSKAFGYADYKNGIMADTNTIYRNGSISKSFTSFLMMQLVQDGIINLDDPVEIYLPEIKQLDGYSDSTIITFHHLACHMSGLLREPKLKNAASGPITEWENKVIESIPKTTFKSKPGEKYSYSNIGFGILGLALSRAANKSFLDLVEEKIFEPLHMDNSYFIVPENKMKYLAHGIEGGPIGIRNTEKPKKEHIGRGYKVPNGGIYCTPNDLARFTISNFANSKLLDKKHLELLHSQHSPGSKDKTRGYAYGFSLYRDSTIQTVSHNGSVSGYYANFIFDRKYEYGVIIMRNYNWGLTNIDLRAKLTLKKLVDFEENN